MSEPPTTTEQVLFPNKYLAGEEATDVAPVSVGAETDVRAQGTVGSAMWWFLLTATYGQAQALDVVEPWAGDSYVVFAQDDELCLATNVLLDSEEDAEAFGDAVTFSLLSTESDTQAQYNVESNGLVRLQVCHAQ